MGVCLHCLRGTVLIVLMLYQMLTGNAPFAKYRFPHLVADAVQAGEQLIRPDDIVFDTLPNIKQLCVACWHIRPDLRPSMPEILPKL